MPRTIFSAGSLPASMTARRMTGWRHSTARFIRQLLSGSRYLSPGEFHSAARRLQLLPAVIALPLPAHDELPVRQAVDQLIQRYSISYVEARAVLLFDIVNFSLYAPFEQTSQLNSLSYSINAAIGKLASVGIELAISRTTTGDGYYVWNRHCHPQANLDLFQLLLLVLADNALARRHAGQQGNGIPELRCGFHIGSHYAFYQTGDQQPASDSYLVGDVTIELARMLELTQPGQILVGEFLTEVPTSDSDSAYLVSADTRGFIDRVGKHMSRLQGLPLSGRPITAIRAFLTGESGVTVGDLARRFRITDKHGRSRHAYNLRLNIHRDNGEPLFLGLQDRQLPRAPSRKPGRLRPGTPATLLKVRPKSTIAAIDE